MEWFPYTTSICCFRVYGNTGYNSTVAVDSQPGRYSWDYSDGNDKEYNGVPYGMIINFPVYNQYIFCNGFQLIMFVDHYFNEFKVNSVSINGRFVECMYIGSIDLYKSDDTNGNIVASSTSTPDYRHYVWSLVGSSAYDDLTVPVVYHVYFEGEGKSVLVNTTSLNVLQSGNDNLGSIGIYFVDLPLEEYYLATFS